MISAQNRRQPLSGNKGKPADFGNLSKLFKSESCPVNIFRTFGFAIIQFI
jgi:hypothetical protein